MWFVPDMITGQSTFSFGEFVLQFVADSRVLMMAMLVFCPLLIWDMLKFSHRIAGPMYRFRSALEEHIAGGPLKAVKLRDGDLMGDFQGTFNEFVAYVHNQSKDVSSAIDDHGSVESEAQSQTTTTA